MTIRVLVVDDSATMRTALKCALQSDPNIEVIGEAANGVEAVQQAKTLHPDVITMDVNMPHLDGFRATEEIMADCPSRILIVCAVDEDREITLSFRSIQAGALEIIAKAEPGKSSPLEWGNKVVEAVRLMSEVTVVRRRRMTLRPATPSAPVPPAGLQIVGIAASTGGPPILASLFADLGAAYPFPILVAQHITAGFSAGFARWLGTQTKMKVELAQFGARALPGHVYLAPDGHHLEVGPNGVLRTTPSVGGHCPSGDRLLSSLARHYGPNALGMILSGMGDDGAQGMLELRKTGALTLGQDKASCVVFGMPQVAAQKGAVSDLLPTEDLKAFLKSFTNDG